MIGRKGGEERKEEERRRGQGEEGRDIIDHVTAPAITSNTLLCFYCTSVPNKTVSCKNRTEKQHRLDESSTVASPIMINFFPLFVNILASAKVISHSMSVQTGPVNNIYA